MNLCTATKTYRVRQVQSSNSIHLLVPSAPQRVRLLSGKTSSDESDLGGVDSVSTIAKCASTLELQSLSEAEEVDIARLALEEKLRVYDRLSVDAVGEDTVMQEDDRGIDSGLDVQRGGEGAIRGRILNEVPTCAARCRAVWRELCGFVSTDLRKGSGGLVAFRPSARVRLDGWKRILEGSVLEGIELGKLFLVSDLWKAVLTEDGEEPFPRELFNAVVRRLAESTGSDDDEAELRCKFLLPQVWAEVRLLMMLVGVSLDTAVVVRFVGEAYLEATAPTERSSIGRTEFLAAWKDLLPEGWREQVSLDKIQVCSLSCFGWLNAY